MVKGTNRHNEEYFQQIDKKLMHNPDKMSRILTIGVVVVGLFFLVNMVMNNPIVEERVYERGLYAGYIPQEDEIQVSYLNLDHDTSNLYVKIYTAKSLLVYEYQTERFPAEISYTPSKNNIYTIVVTATKPSGNYTYTYDTNPKQEYEKWNSLDKYIEMFK